MVSRKLVAACSLLGTASAVPVTAADLPTATVKNGTYSGVYSAEYDQDFFLGMPFAQPALRFTQAQELNSSWEGTKEATAYPPHCVGYGSDDTGYTLSEDCLYLNVIRPAGIAADADLPVLTWIHGGGLFEGGSADKRYNMSFIVENSVKMGTPMIGVSLNYRLDAWGFIGGQQATDAGILNIGFRDQRLALRWINENIQAFGGSPDKVTIWGESAGAQSIDAQVFAYNGRDDGLFRAAIADSGFGGLLPKNTGGYNATETLQEIYDYLVTNTSCASTVGTAESVECLRNVDFDEINYALNVTGVGPWAPVLDYDFIADWPTNQLESGKFVQVPILIGCNTDEGAAFGSGLGPDGGVINSDEDFRYAVRSLLPSVDTFPSGKTVDQVVAELEYVYPNIQSVGIPNLKTFPDVITPNSTWAESLGLQYRRMNALVGDYYFIALRRRASIAWSKFGIPSYSYRFDVVVNGIENYVGSTHFQEVAFVFYNLNGDGYATSPYEGEPASFRKLALHMSQSWVNFVVKQDPNGDGLSPAWPAYDTSVAGGVGQNMVWTVTNCSDASYVETDDARAEAMQWWADNLRDVFGN